MLGRRLACALAALFAVAGTASAETVLKTALHSDLKIIDPIWTTALISTHHGNMVYDTLFALDDKLQVKPQMVDKWETSPDKLTWTFTLRDGLEWHDGKPVTAEDCVARSSAGRPRTRWPEAHVGGGRSQCARCQEHQDGVEGALRPGAGIARQVELERGLHDAKRVADGDPNTQITDATGSGPFIFKKDEWKPARRRSTSRTPSTSRGPSPPRRCRAASWPRSDRVEWITIPDQQTQVSALLNGEIDLIETCRTTCCRSCRRQELKSCGDKAGRSTRCAFNVLHKPFDNAKVARPCSTALDQKPFLEPMSAILTTT